MGLVLTQHVDEQSRRNIQMNIHPSITTPPTYEQYETLGHKGKNRQMGNFFAKVVEETSFIFQSQNNPYSSHYNPSWREQPNFSWGRQQKGQTQNVYRVPHMQNQNQGQRQEERRPRLQNTMTQYMARNNERLKATKTQIFNLVTLVSQQTELNPRKEMKIITLRSEKELKESQKTEKKVAPPKNKSPTKDIAVDVIDDVLTPKKVSVLFPHRLKYDKKDKKIFRKLHINISFVEGIAQIPNYAKFYLRSCPPKLKDPGCFTIPYTLSNLHFEKALCDFIFGRAVIDVKQGKLNLRLGNKEVNFIASNSHKIPSLLVSCNYVQTLDIFDETLSGNYLNTRKPCFKTLRNLKSCNKPIKNSLRSLNNNMSS
ncbi:hypothetical protein CR513_39599, partial [Mucuna pruriens]